MFSIKKIIFFILTYSFIFQVNAEEQKGGMPQLDPSSYSSQLFWLLILFIILFTVINFLFFPKIVNLKKNRENVISTNLLEAENNNNKIDLIKASMDKKIQEAKEQAEEIIKHSVEKSNKIADSKMKKLAKELELREKEFMTEIDKKKSQIDKNISNYSFELSNMMYNKMLNEKKNISLQDFKNLVDNK